jgi:hypothetical protein
MEHLVDFLVWIFTLMGLTMIVTASNIMAPVRTQIAKLHKGIGNLVGCPMCFGFWAGMILSYFYQSVTGNLFFDSLLGSGVAWYITFKR